MYRHRLIVFLVFASILFIGSLIVISHSKASPPNMWACMAVSEYNCDFTGYSFNKKKAKQKAMFGCNVKCAKNNKTIECKVNACARIKREK